MDNLLFQNKKKPSAKRANNKDGNTNKSGTYLEGISVSLRGRWGKPEERYLALRLRTNSSHCVNLYAGPAVMSPNIYNTCILNTTQLHKLHFCFFYLSASQTHINATRPSFSNSQPHIMPHFFLGKSIIII